MKKMLIIITVIGLFILLIIVMTYPLVFNMTTHIPGFFSTDESYAPIWSTWRMSFSLSNDISITKSNLISYPFETIFYSKDMPIGYLWFFINIILAIFTTPILTYNIQVVVNLFLTAFFSYLLVYFLTKNRFCSIVSGVIFGFCPYMFVRSWQHLGDTYLWVTPLLLWSLFKLKENHSLKIKAIFITSIVFTTINFNASYYCFIIGILFLIYLAFRWKVSKAYIKRILFLTAIAALIFIPQFFPIAKNTIANRQRIAPSAHNIYYRSFEDLFEQSARPLSYFLPAVVHPVFGEFTKRFVGSGIYGVSVTEHTLYLGWTGLILAFIAFKVYRKRRKNKQLPVTSYQLPVNNEDFYIGFFVLLAIVAWFFSQPPWWRIGPIKIYMPSFFMYKILPMFRAYCRFGIVVMLAVSVLAGFGLKFILDKFKTKKSKILITSLACGLVLFEFWNYPPFKVIDVSKVPAVYYWLKSQPKDIVIAEYPLDADTPSEMYKFYQTTHEKRMINATSVFSYANKVAKTITKLSEPKTASVLKWMGVKYVLVHKQDYLDTKLIEWVEELGRIPQNPRLKFVESFPTQDCPKKNIMCLQKTGPIDVYEVVATPTQPEINNSEN